jgi:hypothetical protein
MHYDKVHYPKVCPHQPTTATKFLRNEDEKPDKTSKGCAQRLKAGGGGRGGVAAR